MKEITHLEIETERNEIAQIAASAIDAITTGIEKDAVVTLMLPDTIEIIKGPDIRTNDRATPDAQSRLWVKKKTTGKMRMTQPSYQFRIEAHLSRIGTYLQKGLKA